MGQTYLLLGPEKGLKEEFIRKIQSGLGQCEVSKFYPYDNYEEELYAQLKNDDLFAQRKLVLLDEVDAISTAAKAKPLVEYIQNPSDSVTFIMTSDSLFVNSSLMDAVKALGKDSRGKPVYLQTFYELGDEQKKQWLRNYFRQNGFGIEDDAIILILERVENNTLEFGKRCSSMVGFFRKVDGKKIITYDDADKFLPHTKEEDYFSLFSYLAKGKLSSALECLHALFRAMDASGFGITASSLATYFRRALSISININAGLGAELRYGGDDRAFTTKYFSTDRSVLAPNMKKVYAECCKNYSQADIERILATLAEYDIRVKEAGAMQEIMLERCVIDIINRKGRHAETLEFAKLG